MHPERYHVTLSSAGRPVQHGWWENEATARRKFASWIGEWGTVDGAQVTLVDEETGAVLTEWPDPA
jgi:hypothetical protein